MRLLTNDHVKALLDMPATLEALRAGYDDLRQGDAAYVPRIDLYLPTGRDTDYYQWGSMAGACRTYGVVAVRIKSDIASWPDGRTQEKYCVQPGRYCGLILAFRAVDGAPLALLQDGYLQHLRVGAAAAIGSDLLARADATELGLLGSGGMARSFLEALSLVRPLRRVRVYSPTAEHRTRFAAEMATLLGIDVQPVGSPAEAVRNAGIVASATDAMQPTFDPEWLAPGAHVVCVTRRELGAALLQRVDRIVQLGVHTIPPGTPVPMMDWKAGGIAAYVAGQPGERERVPPSRSAEARGYPTLLDVHRGDATGRRSAAERTLFIATGTQGLQFAAVAGKVCQLAEQRSVGKELPLEWFLEDIRD